MLGIGIACVCFAASGSVQIGITDGTIISALYQKIISSYYISSVLGLCSRMIQTKQNSSAKKGGLKLFHIDAKRLYTQFSQMTDARWCQQGWQHQLLGLLGISFTHMAMFFGLVFQPNYLNHLL